MIGTTLGLATFISEHPGLTAWILGGLLTFIAGLLSVYHGVLLHRHGTNAKAIKDLEQRMTTSDAALSRHVLEVGHTRSEFRKMGEVLAKHMDREETEVWAGIRELGERMARIEGELGHIRREMPNGEMAEMLGLLRRLVKG